MAVNFKIPKSPKREIYDIDTFLGVDLTNSGADMDIRRSPNAENMVRYVPGKVRKRAGYYTDVNFGDPTNVNLLAGTSQQETIIDFEEADQTVYLYKLVKDYEYDEQFANNLDVEFDFRVEKKQYNQEYFYISFSDPDDYGVSEQVEFTFSDEWSHCSMNLRVYEQHYFAVTCSLPIILHIKNVAACERVDSNYKWNAAPNHFVDRATTDPIYGCHFAKTNDTFEGNRVVNVNRALNTTSEAESFSISTGWTTIKNLGEAPCPGSKLYIEFDYKATGSDVTLNVGYQDIVTLYERSYWDHYPLKVQLASGYHNNNTSLFRAKCASGSATLEIKNISIMYQKDSNYEWSKAPEDEGNEFPKKDLYFIGRENRAEVDSIDDKSTASGGTLTKNFDIASIPTNEERDYWGYAYLSFEISTSSDNDVDSVDLQIYGYDNGWNEHFPTYDQTFTSHPHKKKIEIFFCIGGLTYPTRIRVVFHVPNNGDCRTTIENIKLNPITPRTSYDMSPIWYTYHVGSDFYLRAHGSNNFTKIFESANKHLSRSWQLNKNLYILDGNGFYAFEIGAGKVESLDRKNAYIPLITIAKEPSGGGTSYDPINLLQPGFYESFQGRSGTTEYQLTFGNLDDTLCEAWVMNQNGSWDIKRENQDFTVNRSTGKITFTTAPGTSPVTGEDNVKILAYRTIEGYRDRIIKCTTGALYGIGGAGDRLFLTGNPEHPNWDFYSQQYDPTYFPDTNYATLGSEQSAITGYAIVNNYLATFKDGFDQSQSVFVREGDLLKSSSGSSEEGDENETTEPVFKLINTLQGEGVVAPYSFGYIQTEPLFLTKQGIYAITEQDITGEKYSQNRSFYLDGKLRKEPNLESAMACVYDDQYILAVNNQLYILDGLQATRTDKSEPYATRQYAGFYCTNVPALCIWQDDGVWFGTNDGKVCAFSKDIGSLGSYNDNGKSIYACWETPDLDGHLFYKNKTFRYFAVRLMQAIKTSAKLYSRKLGVWNFIKEETVIGNLIDFENFDFEMFTFSQDSTEKVIHTKVRVKKVDKARFRVENGEYNEPFGLFDLALEYIESGNYKG